jgi:1-aminocyclopropane-1-carboxylate deaminase
LVPANRGGVRILIGHDGIHVEQLSYDFLYNYATHQRLFSISTLEQQLGIQVLSPEQVITPEWPGAENYSITVKRDDLLHPMISGNKWRKLKYALINIQQQNIKHVVSFGGGFSNHLHALGYCCHKMDIHLTAIVRGDYSANLSPMLRDLISWGHEVNYVDRLTYGRRDDAENLSSLSKKYPDAIIIPEGGSQHLALKGVGEIISELSQNYDYILAPVGSGGTLAGLIHAADKKTKILGVGVLKGEGYLEDLVVKLLPQATQSRQNWQINHQYHFGGYAKASEQLIEFCDNFYAQTNIDIEPVYSAKLFFALRDLITQQVFPAGSKILALHTGGLQGAR